MLACSWSVAVLNMHAMAATAAGTHRLRFTSCDTLSEGSWQANDQDCDMFARHVLAGL